MSMQNVATKTNPLSVIERYKPVAIYEGAFAASGDIIVQREFPRGIIIDHFIIATGTRTGCNVKFEAYIDGEWTEIYGLYYTEHINFTPKNYVEDEDKTTPENGGQPRATNNLWDIVEYDTSNSMYILKLKNVLPIHFRCRITVQNIGSTKANISTQIVGRELL